MTSKELINIIETPSEWDVFREGHSYLDVVDLLVSALQDKEKAEWRLSWKGEVTT